MIYQLQFYQRHPPETNHNKVVFYQLLHKIRIPFWFLFKTVFWLTVSLVDGLGYLFLCPYAKIHFPQHVRHCVMMCIVKSFSRNYSVLWPLLWYSDSFIVRLRFLFQMSVFHNTFHWSHLQDKIKKTYLAQFWPKSRNNLHDISLLKTAGCFLLQV